MQAQRPLSVALLTSGHGLPAWQARALAQLARSGDVRVARILSVRHPPDGLEHFYRRLQESIEALRGPPAASRLGALLDARREFPHAGIVTPEASTGVRRIDDVDLVLNCGVDADGAMRLVGRHGALHCDFSGTPAAVGPFRAVVHGDPRFRITVRLFTGKEDLPLGDARPALPERALLGETEDVIYRRAQALLGKVLRRLASGDYAAPPAYPHASLIAPASTLSVFRYAMRRAVQSLRGRMRRRLGRAAFWLDGHNWFLAYRTNPRDFICNTERFQAGGFKLLLPPEDRAYADPCVFSFGGVEHVFFEEWNPDTDKGVIAWTTLGPDGRLRRPETVLEEPYHLSYPFVFETEDGVFMIPESAAAGSVDLYRATGFPRRWERVARLLDKVSAADPTLLHHDGRWWMFLTLGEQGTSKCDELHLYYADSIYGPWCPHRANPVKIDVSSARPGGRLFKRGRKLIRPSQDCSRSYGGALTLNEVTRLTPDEFEECEIDKLSPDWLPFNTGFHTVSHSARLEVIDGRMLPRGDVRFPGAAGACPVPLPAEAVA